MGVAVDASEKELSEEKEVPLLPEVAPGRRPEPLRETAAEVEPPGE
jgi:hypothetical protein